MKVAIAWISSYHLPWIPSKGFKTKAWIQAVVLVFDHLCLKVGGKKGYGFWVLARYVP